MRSNEGVYPWYPATSSNHERRDYPVREESLIMSMIDMIWSAPYTHDERHCHNCMEIGMCIEGSGVIRINGAGEYHFEPGSVVIVPEGVYHSQQNMGQPITRWRYIAVDEARLTGETPLHCRTEIRQLIRRAQKGGIYLLKQDMTRDIVWLIRQMFELKCSCADDATAQLEAMILLILTRVAREPAQTAVTGAKPASAELAIEPALLYVAESYHQEIRVEQMAKACAMSESHFRKLFLQLMGVAPLEYVNRYRIERAVRMLQTSSSSISRVAEACGFLSITTFNRNFMRYIGQNPTQWRRQNA